MYIKIKKNKNYNKTVEKLKIIMYNKKSYKWRDG